jgi:uncharacterized small protein (DUF1192 family)
MTDKQRQEIRERHNEAINCIGKIKYGVKDDTEFIKIIEIIEDIVKHIEQLCNSVKYDKEVTKATEAIKDIPLLIDEIDRLRAELESEKARADKEKARAEALKKNIPYCQRLRLGETCICYDCDIVNQPGY